MDRVSIGKDEKTLRMKGSDTATELTLKTVSFVLGVFATVFDKEEITACRRR